MLQKKLDAMERDIDNFQNNIGELAALSRSLVDRGHFDSENIKLQQVCIRFYHFIRKRAPSPIAQSVGSSAADEIISVVILLLPLIQEGLKIKMPILILHSFFNFSFCHSYITHDMDIFRQSFLSNYLI